jgi:hypothetical protein
LDSHWGFEHALISAWATTSEMAPMRDTTVLEKYREGLEGSRRRH